MEAQKTTGQGPGWDYEKLRQCWKCNSIAVKIGQRPCGELPKTKEGYYYDWQCRSCGTFQNVPITKAEFREWNKQLIADGKDAALLRAGGSNHGRAPKPDSGGPKTVMKYPEVGMSWQYGRNVTDKRQGERERKDWKGAAAVCGIIILILWVIAQCGAGQ